MDSTFFNEDCTKLLTCKKTEEGSVLFETNHPGCNDGQCKVVEGERQCICNENFILIEGVCQGKQSI